MIYQGLMIPPLVARMNSEEALLVSEFGEQYSAEFHREALLEAWEARRRYATVPKR
jgi:hypothetical protein